MPRSSPGVLPYRAVDEESPEDDDSQEDWTSGLDHLQVAVLVREEDHHGQTADDDALEDEKDGPEDHVEGDDAGGAVHTLVAAFCTLEALELRLQLVEGEVLSLTVTQFRFYFLLLSTDSSDVLYSVNKCWDLLIGWFT